MLPDFQTERSKRPRSKIYRHFRSQAAKTCMGCLIEFGFILAVGIPREPDAAGASKWKSDFDLSVFSISWMNLIEAERDVKKFLTILKKSL